MVPVILKQASPLPATHPLPPLSTALTLSSHFSSPAFAATSFVLKCCHPKFLVTPCFLSRGVTPSSSSPWQPHTVGFPLTSDCSSPPASQSPPGGNPALPRAAHQARGPWLCLLLTWTQTVPSRATGHPAWPWDNAPAPHHSHREPLPAPARGTKPSLHLVPKPGGKVNVSPIPQLNLRVRSAAPVEVLLPSLAYGITQVTIFIFARAVAMVR